MASKSSSEPPRSLRRAVLGFALLVSLFLGMLAALRFTSLGELADRETLIALLERLRQNPWAPLVLLAMYLLLTPLGMPTSPLMAAGGVVFGVFWGSVYNYVGSLLGAVLSYFLARGLGRDLILHVVGSRVEKLDRLMERHGFWAIVRIRFLPIPFPIMNFGPALVGVKTTPFLLGSALGLLLPVPLWTYFWATIFGAAAGEAAGAGRNIALALGIFLLLSFAPRVWLGVRRRRRYRELLEQRRARARGVSDPP
ncbi:MAG: TVP38/TMEM64 family protein [Acidobacteria bacterium]|nr:TVP38/TMEM64 family protein [Acidobacteriota bacterium]